MIKPDWNIFKAKFSDNPQLHFEWLCYLLFCQEYEMYHGIFRYKNQSAIETKPITKNGEVIGWQAKFYETSLSDHKDDFIRMITNSKRDYPNITKIIIYTNQEWGQGKSQNDPKAKIDIEQKARESTIEIEWRTASFFDSPFVTIDNEIIAIHFFTLNKSIISLLEEKRNHTESILYEIQTDIEFSNGKIEIDRSEILQNIQKEISNNQILILSGVGGAGKTAVIKKYYQEIKEKIPFYIFKANELNKDNINDLFVNFSLQDFIEAHREDETKIVIIDSAERLLDIQNKDSFKEFLSTLLKNKWNVIFTIRTNFLENLNYQFIEIYRIRPYHLNIGNFDMKKLNELSKIYGFMLPDDKKLLDLIRTPFYLKEYLKFHDINMKIDYLNFKETLWNNEIIKSKPTREQCFLQVAIQRVKEAQFFVNPNCDPQILEDLIQDGILGYESAGYFITQDIYEEWALEKIIESTYIKRSNNTDFFDKIGEALPIRRTFRNWISEKLLLEDKSIKLFIEETLDNKTIEYHWKDEIIVSVLLSDYSKQFFELFKNELMDGNKEFLKRTSFLLRIACKEVDYDFFKQLGQKDVNLYSITDVLTKPKGAGWNNLIEFIFQNLSNIGEETINYLLPVIHDWNKKSKHGGTTKYASLIALQYYQEIISKKIYFSRDDDITEKLFQTILYGASEIRQELISIFEEILKHKWRCRKDPHYDFTRYILTKFGHNIEVIKVCPEHILKIANLFWFQPLDKENPYSHSGIGVEKYFSLEEGHQDYYPPSAYQTPIYWLLQYFFKGTIDFILCFTNRAVEYYAKSDFAKDNDRIEEVQVIIDDRTSIKQYISKRLWNTYRGTEVSTDLLESIHMALEKFLLESAENINSEKLEQLLLYLLKNSKSASITAVVTSIVLAHPSKTFNIAIILLQTKEIFFYDIYRLVSEKNHTNALLTLSNSFGIDYIKEIYEDERIKACDDKHRQVSIENIIIYYQLFRSKDISENEADRQRIIWNILDEYHQKLPNKQDETEDDKTWRLFLARMDKRKIKPTIEEKEDGFVIHLNPEIDSELRKYIDRSVENDLQPMKYGRLKLWAKYKIKNDQKHQQYTQYENNPQLALKEVKDIVDTLRQAPEEAFYLFNYSIPADVCSILLKEYFDKLSVDEKVFCKNIVLDFASQYSQPNYIYQISDGTQSAISVLPLLLQKFPDEKGKIKLILILAMFKDDTVDMTEVVFNKFSIMGIDSIWSINFEEAQSLLFGYLLLKPRYETLKNEIIYGKYGGVIQGLSELNEKFIAANKEDIQKVIENKISFDDLKEIEQLDTRILKTAFNLIPYKTENKEHKMIAQCIISTFAKELLSNEKKKTVDYNIKHSFLKKLAYFTLSSSEQDISNYLMPFIDNFNSSETIADLFEEFILAEDRLNTYDHFWVVWDLFYGKVVELSKDGNQSLMVGTIIKSYLFAQTPWKETTTNWMTLKENNKQFFIYVVKSIGHCTSTLYSISKLLNGIGSKYLNNGAVWISEILSNNENLYTNKLETNTVYYIERFIQKYIYEYREEVRKSPKLKQEILIILGFLIEKGSVVGYMLREDIL